MIRVSPRWAPTVRRTAEIATYTGLAVGFMLGAASMAVLIWAAWVTWGPPLTFGGGSL